MKFVTAPSSKNITEILCIVAIEIYDLASLLVLYLHAFTYKKNITSWGHPHSTYTQRERGGVLNHKILKTFFVQKKLLHCHLLLCIEKCKPALSYKQKP